MERSDAIEAEQPTWWGRLRAAGLLALLLIAIGATTALAIGAVLVGLVTLLDRALG